MYIDFIDADDDKRLCTFCNLQQLLQWKVAHTKWQTDGIVSVSRNCREFHTRVPIPQGIKKSKSTSTS